MPLSSQQEQQATDTPDEAVARESAALLERRRIRVFFMACSGLALLMVVALQFAENGLRGSFTSVSHSVKAGANEGGELSSSGRAEATEAEPSPPSYLSAQKQYSQRPELPQITEADWVKHVDPVAGFQLQVPEFWIRQTLHADEEPGDSGYAVVFQSPLTSQSDQFADYIMVEFLDNAEAGFDSAVMEQSEVLFTGQIAIHKRIQLLDHPVADTSLNLVVYQLTQQNRGLSLGLYVVGQQREAHVLESIYFKVVESFLPPGSQRRVSL